MALRASDLPDDVKRQLSRAIREQVGPSKYDQAVDAVGEDRVLDMVLLSASGGGDSSQGSTTAPESPWAAAWSVTSTILGQLWWLIPACLGSGWAGFVFLLGGLILLFFGVALFKAIGALEAASVAVAWIVGVLAVVTGAGLVGYLLWIGVPWLISGVGQWWGWLGGHFM